MKKALVGVFGVVILLGLSVVGGAFFIVGETQQAVIFQFGEPRGDPITTPGLKLKLPFIQKVTYFDNRFLEWDGDPNEVPTRDKRFIHVDTYARWRITDPLKYFQRLRNEQGAQSRLDDILDGETRNVIANHDLIEAVRSSNREFAITELIAGDAAADLWPLGQMAMTAEEAAEAVKVIGPRKAIPMHWGDIIGGREDAEKFKKIANCEVQILEPRN